MKKALVISAAIFLLILPTALAQNSNSTSAQANRTWPAFWRQFGAAIKTKNRVALKGLMAPEGEFFSGGGGETRDEWITMIGWKRLRTALTIGTMPYNKGQNPGRITKDKGLIFEFVSGRWRFTGVMGD